MGAEQSRSHELALKSAAGDVEGVRRLLAIYLNQQRHQAQLVHTPPNQRVDINYALPEGDFPLELAVTHGHTLVCQLLLEHGCNADQQDSDGLTALMCAVHERSTAITLHLLRLGKANVDLRDSQGWTALHHAAKNGHAAQADLLLHHSASLAALDKEGVAPLQVACMAGHWEVAKVMLIHLQALAQARVQIDVAALVQPCLIPAAQAAQWDVVTLLLELGGDSNHWLPSGGKVVDLLPSFVLRSLRGVGASRRADVLIDVLYPFLTSSILEEVLDFEQECYVDGNCIGLQRIIHHLRTVSAEQDRAADEATRQKLAAALISRSAALNHLSPASHSDVSSSSSGAGGPSPSPTGSEHVVSVSGGGDAMSGLAPPSQVSTQLSKGNRLAPHSPRGTSSDVITFDSSPSPLHAQQQHADLALPAGSSHFVFQPVPPALAASSSSSPPDESFGLHPVDASLTSVRSAIDAARAANVLSPDSGSSEGSGPGKRGDPASPLLEMQHMPTWPTPAEPMASPNREASRSPDIRRTSDSQKRGVHVAARSTLD